MEEKNITNQTNEVKQTKPAPQAKAKKKDNDKDTFADYKAEFKKIVWPTRIEVVKKTATVIVLYHWRYYFLHGHGVYSRLQCNHRSFRLIRKTNRKRMV